MANTHTKPTLLFLFFFLPTLFLHHVALVVWFHDPLLGYITVYRTVLLEGGDITLPVKTGSILLHRCDYRLPMLSWYMETPGQRSDIAMGLFNKFSSVAQSCPTLCNLMNRRTPGLPVQHQLPGSTQTRVHRVGDAIQPSHPLSSPSPPALNLSQHQGLFK